VADTILLVCAVLGTVTSLVTGFIAWDNWRQEKRYGQTPERVGNGSILPFLPRSNVVAESFLPTSNVVAKCGGA
jgi:hypothetical protein